MADPANVLRGRRRRLTLPVRNDIARMLWNVAHRLYIDPEQFLPRCPDCGIAPDFGDDQECDVCAYKQGRQLMEEAHSA